jgi:repressor LexA
MKQAMAAGLRRQFLPMVGRHRRYRPVETFETPEPSPLRFHLPKDVFVAGDGESMGRTHRGRRLHPGGAHPVARREIVVALVEGTGTLPRIYKEGDRVRLQPSNVNMAAIVVPAASVASRVIGVLRNFPGE